MRPRVPDDTVDTLVDELKQLRQRGCVATGPVAPRLTPTTRTAFGVYDTDDEEATRTKVLSRLHVALEALPEETRTALAVAFGLEPAYRGRYYKDRVAAFANTRGVNPRTVRRQVDRGLEPLARELLAPGPHPGRAPAWWTKSMTVALALDLPAPESLVIRHVVAARDGLTELDLATTITEADARTVLERVSFDVFYGGRLQVGPMESSDRVRLVLALPAPLRQGQTHEFAVRTRLPPDFDLRQHYVCVPRNPCGRVDLRMRFAPDNLPRQVSRLVNVYQRDIDDPATTAEDVPLDATGEVHARFDDLTTDRATGLRWRF